MMPRRTAMTLLLAALASGLAGCAADTAASPAEPAAPPAPEVAATETPAAAPLEVVANFYPVEFLARRIGGDLASVAGLTPANTEPHDLALTGPALASLSEAAAVLYLGQGFQPDVERAVTELPDDVRTLDLLSVAGLELLTAEETTGGVDDGHGHGDEDGGELDPHVWLDPVRMKVLAQSIFDIFVAADPDDAAGYAANLTALQSDLDSLDAHLRDSLDSCRQRVVVTSHAAFGYLTARYELRQLPISGLSPDAEPDPRTLAEITDSAAEAGVGTVYFEEALSPELTETVAAAIGARIELLAALEFDPGEAIGSGADYLSVMRENADRLEAGLDCP